MYRIDIHLCLIFHYYSICRVLERFIIKCFDGYSWFRVCTSLFDNINSTGSIDEVAMLITCILNTYDELVDAVVANNVKLVHAKLKPIPMYLKRPDMCPDADATVNSLTSSLSRSSASSSLLYMTDESGWTLLHHCAHHNCVDVLKELVGTYGFSLAVPPPNDSTGPVRYCVDHGGQSVLHVAMKALQYDIITCLLDHYGMRSVQHALLDDRGFTPLVALLSTISLNNTPPKTALSGGNSRRNWSSCLTGAQLHEIIASLLPDSAAIAFSSQYQIRHTNKCDIWARSERPCIAVDASMEEEEDLYTEGFDKSASFQQWKRLREQRGQVAPLRVRAKETDTAEVIEPVTTSDSVFELVVKHCKDYSTVKLMLDIAMADFLIQLQIIGNFQSSMPDPVQQNDLQAEVVKFNQMIRQLYGVVWHVIRANKFKILCALCEKFDILFDGNVSDVEGMPEIESEGANGEGTLNPYAEVLQHTVFAPQQQAEFVAACVCLAIKQRKSIRILSLLFTKLRPHLKGGASCAGADKDLVAAVGGRDLVLPVLQHAVLSEDPLVLGLVTEELHDSLVQHVFSPWSTITDPCFATRNHSYFTGLADWRSRSIGSLICNIGQACHAERDTANEKFFAHFSPVDIACLCRDAVTLKLLLNKASCFLSGSDAAVGEIGTPVHRVVTADLLCGKVIGTGSKDLNTVRCCVNPLLCCVLVGALSCVEVLRGMMDPAEFHKLVKEEDSSAPDPLGSLLQLLHIGSNSNLDSSNQPGLTMSYMLDSARLVNAFSQRLTNPLETLGKSLLCPEEVRMKMYRLFADACEESGNSSYLPSTSSSNIHDVNHILAQAESCDSDANCAIYGLYSCCAEVLSAGADGTAPSQPTLGAKARSLCSVVLTQAIPVISQMKQGSITRSQMLKQVLTSKQFQVSIRKLKLISSSNPEFGAHSKWSKLIELMSKLLEPHGLKSKQNTPAAAGGLLGGVDAISPLLAAAVGGSSSGPVSPVKQLLKLYGNENKIVENIDVMLLPVVHNEQVLFTQQVLSEELVPLYNSIAHNALTDPHEVLSNRRGVTTADSESVFDRGASPPYLYALRALSAWVMNTMHELCAHYDMSPGGRDSDFYAQSCELTKQFDAGLRSAVEKHLETDSKGGSVEENLEDPVVYFQRRCKVLLSRTHSQLLATRKLRVLNSFTCDGGVVPGAKVARSGIGQMTELGRRTLEVFLPSTGAEASPAADVMGLQQLCDIVCTFVNRNLTTVSKVVVAADSAVLPSSSAQETRTQYSKHQYHSLFESVLPRLHPRITPAGSLLPPIPPITDQLEQKPVKQNSGMERILCDLVAKGAFDELLALPQGYSVLRARSPQSTGHHVFLMACVRQMYAFARELMARCAALELNTHGAGDSGETKLQNVAHPTIPLHRCGVLYSLKQNDRSGNSTQGQAQHGLLLHNIGPRYSHVMRGKSCSTGTLVRDTLLHMRETTIETGVLGDLDSPTSDKDFILLTPLHFGILDHDLEFLRKYCKQYPSLSIDISAVLLAAALNHHDIVLFLVSTVKIFTNDHHYESHQCYSSLHWWMWGLSGGAESDHFKCKHLRNVNMDGGFVNFLRAKTVDRSGGLSTFNQTVLLPLLLRHLFAAEADCFTVSSAQFQPEFSFHLSSRLDACVDKLNAQNARIAEGRVLVDTERALAVDEPRCRPPVVRDGQGGFTGLFLNLSIAGDDQCSRESVATVPLIRRGALLSKDTLLAAVTLQEFRSDVGFIYDAVPGPLESPLSTEGASGGKQLCLPTALRALSGMSASDVHFLFWKQFVVKCLRGSWGLSTTAHIDSIHTPIRRLEGTETHLGLAIDKTGKSALNVAAEQSAAFAFIQSHSNGSGRGGTVWHSKKFRKISSESNRSESLHWVRQLVGDLVELYPKSNQQSLTAGPGGVELDTPFQPLALPQMLAEHSYGRGCLSAADILRARHKQLEMQFLHPALSAMRLAQVQLDQYRRSARALTMSASSSQSPVSSTDAISSLLSPQTINNMHLHRVLLEHLDNCQNTWGSLMSAAASRSGSGRNDDGDATGFVHLQSLMKHCQDPANVGLHGDGHILDSLFRLKRLLIILGIPYSRLLLPHKTCPSLSTPGDDRMQSEMVAEAQVRSGMGNRSCWVLNKEIETFSYLSPSKLREIIPWSVAEEIKEVLQGWISNRVVAPQSSVASTALNNSSRSHNVAPTRRASRLSTTSLNKVLVGRLLHHHKSSTSAPLTLQVVEKLTTLDINLVEAEGAKLSTGTLGLSQSSFPLMGHRGVDLLPPLKEEETGRALDISSSSMKENINSSWCSANSQVSMASTMSYYPTMPSAQLQIYSLPTQLQLETLHSYRNIGKNAPCGGDGASVGTHQYTKKYSSFLASWSGKGVGERFRSAGFVSSTPVSRKNISSEFQLEVLQALNCSYMLLDFVRSLYMARVLASCSTEWEVDRSAPLEEGEEQNIRELVHPHPLDILYSNLEQSSRYVASVNETITSIVSTKGTPLGKDGDGLEFVDRLKVYDCQSHGSASRISSQQTLDGISLKEWKTFCTSINITKLVAPVFHRFRLVLLDMLSLLCLSQEQYAVCTALCGSIRRSQQPHVTAIASQSIDESSWTEELFRLLCSLRICDLCPAAQFSSDTGPAGGNTSLQHHLHEIKQLMRYKAPIPTNASAAPSKNRNCVLAEPFASWSACNNPATTTGATVSTAAVESELRSKGISWAQVRSRGDIEELQRVLLNSDADETKSDAVDTRAGMLASLSREVRSGYLIMEKIMRFLQRAVNSSELADIYASDSQRWVGTRFVNPLLPLIMSPPDAHEGERTALCRDLIYAHTTASSGCHTHAHCLISMNGTGDSNGHNAIVLASLLGRDGMLQLFLSEATYGYAAKGPVQHAGTALDTLLWYVLWNVPSMCSSVSCSHCSTACEEISPVSKDDMYASVPQCVCQRNKFENCVAQLLRYDFSCRKPEGAIQYCSDIAMIKQLPFTILQQIAAKELDLDRSNAAPETRTGKTASARARAAITRPVLPLSSLQLLSMQTLTANGTIAANHHADWFNIVFESAALRATHSNLSLGDSLIATSDIDIHVEFMKMHIPDIPMDVDLFSKEKLTYITPLVAPSTGRPVSTGSIASMSTKSDTVEEYVRYHLAASVVRLVDGGSAENRHRCCPLRDKLCEAVSRDISPAHFSHLDPSSHGAANKTQKDQMMSAELEQYSPLVCALAFQPREQAALGSCNRNSTPLSVALKLLERYFAAKTDSGTANGDELGLNDSEDDDEVMLMQKLLQYSCFYDRQEELIFVLNKFCYVEGADTDADATSSLSISSVAASLAYYFEPLHRICNLVEIAVYSNAYECVRCLLPVPPSASPSTDRPDGVSPGSEGVLPLDWKDLLVTALLNYQHSALPYIHPAHYQHAYPHTTERRVVFEYLLHFVNRVVGADLTKRCLDTVLVVQLGHGTSSAPFGSDHYVYQQHSRGRMQRPVSRNLEPTGVLSGETMTHVVIRHGNLKLLQLLLSYGAAANSLYLCPKQGDDGKWRSRYNILDYSIYFGHGSVTRYLGRGGALSFLSVNIGQGTAQSSYFPTYNKAVKVIIRVFREFYLRKKVGAKDRKKINIVKYS